MSQFISKLTQGITQRWTQQALNKVGEPLAQGLRKGALDACNSAASAARGGVECSAKNFAYYSGYMMGRGSGEFATSQAQGKSAEVTQGLVTRAVKDLTNPGQDSFIGRVQDSALSSVGLAKMLYSYSRPNALPPATRVMPQE